MANAKISALTELTTPASVDVFAIVDDPAGTPATKKVTLANLLGNVPSGQSVGWSNVKLFDDAANTLALRNGAAAQVFNIYNTHTDESNYERGFMRWSSNVLEIGTEAAGTGSNRNVSMKAGANSATLSAGGSLTLNSGLLLSWVSRITLESPSFGVLRISDSNRAGFSRLQLGGTTSSFPAIKRNATGIDIRLADDSAYAPLAASTLLLSSLPTSDPVMAGQVWNDSGTLKISAG